MSASASQVRGTDAALLKGHVLRASRIRDGLQVTQRLLSVRDDGFCILSHRVPTQDRKADRNDRDSLQHSVSSSSLNRAKKNCGVLLITKSQLNFTEFVKPPGSGDKKFVSNDVELAPLFG